MVCMFHQIFFVETIEDSELKDEIYHFDIFFFLRTVLIFLLWMALWKDSEVSSLDAFCLFLDSAGGV